MEAWLNEQAIFITGATGFLGKVLLARLLEPLTRPPAPAPAPGALAPAPAGPPVALPARNAASPIFVLVRGKRDMPAQIRFEKEVLASPIFRRVLTAVGGAQGLRRSVRVLDGDLTLARLGLRQDDHDVLTSTATVILHLAATVNFNEPLKLAVEINILGSKRVLDLAKKCTRLTAFVHTSTCYVNCTRFGKEEVRERMYPLTVEPAALLDTVAAMTADEADRATPDLIRPHPNTYTFTKFIAEHVLAEERGTVPYAIVRPSIIGGAHRFPVPGWVDSYIGPAGLVAASGLGALRVMVGDGEALCDLVPVDLVANLLLAVAAHVGRLPPATRGQTVPIFHAATSQLNPLKWNWLRQGANGHYWRNRLQKGIAPPHTFFSRYGVRFYVLQTLFGLGPAAVSDAKLMALGQKRKYVRQMQTLMNIVESLRFFTTHSWFFSAHNSIALAEQMGAADEAAFSFDVRRIHWELYLVNFYNGIRYLLLKEPIPPIGALNLPYANL